MTETPKTVWVTKYALTDGIWECEVKKRCDERMVYVAFPKGSHDYMHGKDWHLTREAAVARAEQMRSAKLASLDKQAERIRGLVF